MSYEFIRFEVANLPTGQAGGVGRITLNRPDVLNSFNLKMAQETQDALDKCAEDPAIRAIYLTGEGRAFCAGQDLAEAIAEDAPDIAQIVEAQYNPIIRRLRSIEKPIVGAVNGVAAGAGANIAYACDVAVAAESASFIQSFSNIGLIPDSGGTYTLPRMVGMQRAFGQMIFAGKVKGPEAKELGMIWDCFPDEEFAASSLALAERLAVMPTKGIGLTKKALNASLSNTLDEQLEVEKELQAQAGATYDNREGINAFLEKRKPEFKGE